MSNIINKISSLIGENGTISDNLARNSGRKCLPITSIICVVEGTLPDSNCLVSHSLPTLDVNRIMELEKSPSLPKRS